MKLVCCKTGGRLVNNKLNNCRCVCSFFLTLFSLVVIPLQTVFFLFGLWGYTVFTSVHLPNHNILVSLKYLEKGNDGIMSPQLKGVGGAGAWGGGHIAFLWGSCWRWHCSFSALCLLNQRVYFDQTCTDTLLGER